MTRFILNFAATLTAMFALSGVAQASTTGPIKLRSVSRMAAAAEPATQEMIKVLKKAIESNCLALSPKDQVEIVTDRVTASSADVGRFRSSQVLLLRKSGGQHYAILAYTGWDLEHRRPEPVVRLEARYCR